MQYDFNADDVFEMAEQLERNGAKFYEEASGKVDDEVHKAFLVGLSKMEIEHEKTFASMRDELKEKESAPTAFDPEGDAGLYLRALADTRVFFEKKMDDASMEGILKAAIQAEKDSIVFYLGMKDLVPGPLGVDKLDKIIREEMYHVRNLSSELLKLKGLGGC